MSEIKYEKDPVLSKGEKNAISILALEGIEVNAYNIYLVRLRQKGTITMLQSGMAAIEYEKTGKKVY